MTPEQQRIAIAEACPHIFVRPLGSLGWNYRLLSGQVLPCIDGDPLSDLNAMHEAEKVFTDADQKHRYLETLAEVVMDASCYEINAGHAWRVTTATASQRVEAFLRTIGKWVD